MTNQRMKESPQEAEASTGRWGKTRTARADVIGMVYGDIGTSPLYAVRECFFGKERIQVSETDVLGILSLVAWALILVISMKYLLFVLRADYDGEGGILALMELVKRPSRGQAQKIILILGLFGAALLYGDGMITPARRFATWP
jgi:KUP system potassium uptake protein